MLPGCTFATAITSVHLKCDGKPRERLLIASMAMGSLEMAIPFTSTAFEALALFGNLIPHLNWRPRQPHRFALWTGPPSLLNLSAPQK